MNSMKNLLCSLFLGIFVCLPSFAAPLGSNARSVIPQVIQQIISADCRALRDSPAAYALKERLLPETLKQFETALSAAGIHPERDLEQLTFVTYRLPNNQLRSVGIAQGSFNRKEFLQKMHLRGIRPEKYLLSSLYPMGSGMQLVFLDPMTIVFGENAALKGVIDVRDIGAPSLESNDTVNSLIADADSAPVWSVLDQLGTQTMMKSVLGQASSLANYEVIKKRLLASSYVMNFSNGMTFDLIVRTSDTMTAASLASLAKVGVLYRKMTASPAEQAALENTTVDSTHDMLQLHFRADDQRFEALLKTDLFAAVTR